MTLVVSITYQDGRTETLYEFSPFIRKDGGSWYKIVQNDASNFHTFLNELKNEYCLTLTDFDVYCTVSEISSVNPKTIKLSKTDNTCQFGYGIESSVVGLGTYELTDTILTLTLEQNHVYVFNVVGEDLVFDADKSTSPVVEDGTVFKKVRNRAINITIKHTLPSCIAIEDDCFYGTDEEGHLWRILYSDTSNLTEGKTYFITVKSTKELTYPDGYPDDGWSPKYEATAIEVILNK